MGLIRHLRDSEPFDALPDEVVEELREAATEEEFPAHHYIFHHMNHALTRLNIGQSNFCIADNQLRGARCAINRF